MIVEQVAVSASALRNPYRFLTNSEQPAQFPSPPKHRRQGMLEPPNWAQLVPFVLASVRRREWALIVTVCVRTVRRWPRRGMPWNLVCRTGTTSGQPRLPGNSTRTASGQCLSLQIVVAILPGSALSYGMLRPVSERCAFVWFSADRRLCCVRRFQVCRNHEAETNMLKPAFFCNSVHVELEWRFTSAGSIRLRGPVALVHLPGRAQQHQRTMCVAAESRATNNNHA